MRRSGTALPFLLTERTRESADSGSVPVSPLGTGVILRRFSGTPLLPPLSSRLGSPGETDPGTHVVFTIEARGTEQSRGPAPGRCHISSSSMMPRGGDTIIIPIFQKTD